MNSTYAIVTNGVVSNMVLWDGVSAWTPPTGSTVVPADANVAIGYNYDGTKFIPPSAPTPPAPTPDDIAAQLVCGGLTVNSTSTPALNGTYAVDTDAQHNIMAVINYILVNNEFPGHTSTYPWADMKGQFHIMPNTATFQAFGTAIANYVAQIKLYAAGAPGVAAPSPTVTIA